MRVLLAVHISAVLATDSQCCQDDTLECLACNAGVDKQKYCGQHRDTPGCDDICCDEGCSALCTLEERGEFYIRKVCPYEVEDQTADAWVPTILQSDVETSCPWPIFGDMNLMTCQDCAKMHQPCNDTYMACGGCKCTEWHQDMNFDVPTKHTCGEIKKYFKTKNQLNVTCKDRSLTAPDPNNTGRVGFTTHNNTYKYQQTLAKGIISAECTTPINCLKCDKIPFKLKFECDTCGNRGVPLLLKKCCDVCKAWVDGLQNDTRIPDHIKGYGWCSGCHVDGMPSFMTNRDIPWKDPITGVPYKKLYVNYTEKVADEGMEQHVEDNICSLLAPECEKEETHPTEAPTTTTTPLGDDRRTNFHGCMHQTGQCGGAHWGGGRRLDQEEARRNRFLEAIGQVDARKAPLPDVSCPQFNASLYKKEPEASVTLNPNTATPEKPDTTTLGYANKAPKGFGTGLVALFMVICGCH